MLYCKPHTLLRYEFPLEEMDGHIVEINLYDKDHGSKNEFLGYAAIDVKNFMQQSSLLAGIYSLTMPPFM
jgi:Ca2+-dependent lipid-binding protein